MNCSGKLLGKSIWRKKKNEFCFEINQRLKLVNSKILTDNK